MKKPSKNSKPKNPVTKRAANAKSESLALHTTDATGELMTTDHGVKN